MFKKIQYYWYVIRDFLRNDKRSLYYTEQYKLFNLLSSDDIDENEKRYISRCIDLIDIFLENVDIDYRTHYVNVKNYYLCVHDDNLINHVLIKKLTHIDKAFLLYNRIRSEYIRA